VPTKPGLSALEVRRGRRPRRAPQRAAGSPGRRPNDGGDACAGTIELGSTGVTWRPPRAAPALSRGGGPSAPAAEQDFVRLRLAAAPAGAWARGGAWGFRLWGADDGQALISGTFRGRQSFNPRCNGGGSGTHRALAAGWGRSSPTAPPRAGSRPGPGPRRERPDRAGPAPSNYRCERPAGKFMPNRAAQRRSCARCPAAPRGALGPVAAAAKRQRAPTTRGPTAASPNSTGAEPTSPAASASRAHPVGRGLAGFVPLGPPGRARAPNWGGANDGVPH